MKRAKNKNLKKNGAAVVCVNEPRQRTNICYDLRSYGNLVLSGTGHSKEWGGYKVHDARIYLAPCVELYMPKSLL